MMTITHLPSPKPAFDAVVLEGVKEKLMPEYMFEIGALGAGDYHEQWAHYLLHIACGTAQPKDGGGVVLADKEKGAAAWASTVFVHDDPVLEAMGPDGMTDGHVLLVPLEALKRRNHDPMTAAQWMGDGAVACARLAMGSEDVQPGAWTIVTRERLREVLAKHHHSDYILQVMPNAPEQDAWRYASAMLAYGNNPNGELTGLAKGIEKTELNDGWANKEWAVFLDFESDKWERKKNGALLGGVQKAVNRHAMMLLDLRTMPQKLRMTHLLLSHLGGDHSMDDLSEFTRGIVQHPDCTEGDRTIVIYAASSYNSQNFKKAVEISWKLHQIDFAGYIKAQQWWLLARETGDEALYIPAMVGLVKNLHKLDHAGNETLTKDFWLRTPINSLSTQDAVQLIAWIRVSLDETAELSEHAVHDLAQCLPSTACQWIAKNPQNAGARDDRTRKNFDLIEALTLHIDDWIERDGHGEVAERLASVISSMPLGHAFDVNTMGWWYIKEAAGENKAFWSVYDAASKVDPGFANKALMSLAMDVNATLGLIEHVVSLGGNPLAVVDIQYINEASVPERILDVGRRHDNMAVRTCFRRVAQQQPEQEQDNVIVLRSPRISPGRSGP